MTTMTMVMDLTQLSFSLMIWTWTENGIGFFFYFIYEKLIQSFYMYVNKNIIYLLFNCTLMVGWKAYYLEHGQVGQWCILVAWLQRFLLIFFLFQQTADRQTNQTEKQKQPHMEMRGRTWKHKNVSHWGGQWYLHLLSLIPLFFLIFCQKGIKNWWMNGRRYSLFETCMLLNSVFYRSAIFATR